jgi:pimeloyl-ACP methyl ester carboxylesterase
VLGHPRFAAQGGDWGGFITSRLGAVHPDKLIGIHVNLLAVRRDPKMLSDPTPEEQAFLRELEHWLKEETGYQAIQGTKPQTLAFGLSDSPAGLAAWIVEKFRTWSDCDGDVERRFTKDQLLDNVMLYWITGTAHSAGRLYYEAEHTGGAVAQQPIDVPVGVAAFPAEIIRPPRRWAEGRYDLRQWTEMPRGGHFAAFEEPELLVNDVRKFFRPLRIPS